MDEQKILDKITEIQILIDLLEDAAMNVYKSRFHERAKDSSTMIIFRDEATMYDHGVTRVTSAGPATLIVEFNESMLDSYIRVLDKTKSKLMEMDIPMNLEKQVEDVVNAATASVSKYRNRLEVINRIWTRKAPTE